MSAWQRDRGAGLTIRVGEGAGGMDGIYRVKTEHTRCTAGTGQPIYAAMIPPVDTILLHILAPDSNITPPGRPSITVIVCLKKDLMIRSHAYVAYSIKRITHSIY